MSKLHEIEHLEPNATGGLSIDRLRVPSGWIYYADFPGYGLVTATFVHEEKEDD